MAGLTITGNDNPNLLQGGSGNDTISGLGGPDTIIGGAGDDLLYGSDSSIYDLANPYNNPGQNIEYLPNLFEPGAGNDTVVGSSYGDAVSYADAKAGVLVDLRSSQNFTTYFDGGGGLAPVAQNTGGSGTDTLININSVVGSPFNDTLYGAYGSVLDGGSGGNDVFYGYGTDSTISYASATAAVTVDLALSTPQNTGGAGIDTLQPEFYNYYSASGFDRVIGSKFNDVLYGAVSAPGPDNYGVISYLNGGPGADTLVGAESGSTMFIVDNVGDKIIDDNPLSIYDDQITSSVSYTLPAEINEMTMTGTGKLVATGNDNNDVMYGSNTANNVINGMGGFDQLHGGDLNDTLNGGVNAVDASGAYSGDDMYGGKGDDLYYVDSTLDLVSEDPDAGTDTVNAGVSYTLPENVEDLTFRGAGNFTGTGNDENNVITGNSGNNILNGEGGADTLTGGAGADTFVFSSLADFGAGSALDTITDFSHGQGDKIDLHLIDPSATEAGDQSFTFIGANAFTKGGTDFEVRYQGTFGGNFLVQIDTNHDGVADASFVVKSSTHLVANDFIL